MVEVQVANHARGQRKSIQAWIDTAFDGHLVMSKSEIERLGLGVLADTDAALLLLHRGMDGADRSRASS